MNEESVIVVGTVGRPWGIKGQFLVDPRGSDPERLVTRGRLRIRRVDGTQMEYPILKSHFAGGRLVIQVEGCTSPEDAEGLRGAQVLLPKNELAAAPEGSYYPHQITGLNAVTKDGRNLGVVERLVSTAGTDLLEIRSGAREILVPFVENMCRVDVAAGTVTIDPPEGLLELD